MILLYSLSVSHLSSNMGLFNSMIGTLSMYPLTLHQFRNTDTPLRLLDIEVNDNVIKYFADPNIIANRLKRAKKLKNLVELIKTDC